ncbi:hypothetical protein ACFC26_07855 [Kitasatospora purpeofusca]|uniref:hypothetical protein n=1 Tax=Kitasatospora purpeofusca TaxID=67352 RepID=UPI0035E07C6A
MSVDLVALGAPVLPAGMFYRIRPHPWGWIEFEIRERRRFGSRLVAGSETHVDPTDYPTTNEALTIGCQTANDRRIAALNRRSAYSRAAAHAGDYETGGGVPRGDLR